MQVEYVGNCIIDSKQLGLLYIVFFELWSDPNCSFVVHTFSSKFTE